MKVASLLVGIAGVLLGQLLFTSFEARDRAVLVGPYLVFGQTAQSHVSEFRTSDGRRLLKVPGSCVPIPIGEPGSIGPFSLHRFGQVLILDIGQL
jgi:hypothetical protein